MNQIRLAILFLAAFLQFSPALADPGSDAVKLYKRGLSRIVARQRKYESKALAAALRDAYEIYRAPWMEGDGPEAPKVIDYDFSGYADVYERWASFNEEKGELARSMADSGGELVAERLVETLFYVLMEINRQDQELLDSRPKIRSLHDQTPGLKRYGAWLHRDCLVKAMAGLDDDPAVGYLAGKGWDYACRWDRGKKSVRARTALLDAMAGSDADEVRAIIEEAVASKESGIRIAAFEALAVPEVVGPVRDRLREAAAADPCFAVRATAQALLGDTGEEAPEGSLDFCGIPIESLSFIVVMESSFSMFKPADIELLKTRTWREWRSVAEKNRGWLTQTEFLVAETYALVNRLPKNAHFNFVLLGSANRPVPLLPRGMVPASSKGRRLAVEFLNGIRPEGWAPQREGLLEALRIAGYVSGGTRLPDQPEAEMILLFSNGVPRGGRLLYGPAIVDDVRRSFRLHRLPIHTVRVDDAAEPAEEVMKGIAEATGGKYVHVTKP